MADVAASGGGCTIQCNSYNVGDARSEHETIASDSTLECPAAPGCRSPAVVERTETASGRRTWWLLREPTSALEPLPVEGTVQNAPLLSNGGDGIGWVADVPDSGPPVLTIHLSKGQRLGFNTDAQGRAVAVAGEQGRRGAQPTLR